MATVVSLKYTRTRYGGHVCVLFDDGSTLNLDADLTVQYHLARGMELQEEQIHEIQHAQCNLAARRRLIHYVSTRRKTIAEARRYLLQHDFPPDAVEKALDAAQSLGYLDDSNYASAYVNTQAKTSLKGPRALQHDLGIRGVDREIVDSATRATFDKEYQMIAARALAAKKVPSLKVEDKLNKAAKKLINYLLRKGYEQEIASAVTREFLGDPTEE